MGRREENGGKNTQHTSGIGQQRQFGEVESKIMSGTHLKDWVEVKLDYIITAVGLHGHECVRQREITGP